MILEHAIGYFHYDSEKDPSFSLRFRPLSAFLTLSLAVLKIVTLALEAAITERVIYLTRENGPHYA